MLDTLKQQLPDLDPQETQEWLDALESVVTEVGKERARFILRRVLKKARLLQVGLPGLVRTPYINTISPEQEPSFPGDEQMELRIRRMIRWNAAAMVNRANKNYPGIGGHISTYASSASLYEVGFNHFFRGKNDESFGDHVFFQGHAAPGIYARSFLEGRFGEDTLDYFRRETQGKGLPSYPHPRLLPDYWEYPTVSMGLGPMAAIYQARFNRYLHSRGIKNTEDARVWCFVGDGEMDEPEARGALSMAAREQLDNLVFVVNCNLQRLDGPVRGNSKIIQELEALYRGAGWNVIKVIWGREWDDLLKRDVHSLLLDRMNETVDGWFQKYSVESGSFIRNHFFGGDPRLLELVSHLSDKDITRLRRGGHDYRKIYAAYKWATEHFGQPTVILAHTVKGWTLGEGFEAKNVTHQMKKLDLDELKAFRDRLELPIPDDKLAESPYYHPGANSEEIAYMLDRRKAMGGVAPTRVTTSKSLNLPAPNLYGEFDKGTPGDQTASTTMAFVRLLSRLLRDKEIGQRIVPIVPDEGRTFGMDALFKNPGIYSSVGQLYDPVDKAMLMSYHEARDGQLIQEGINEAGSMATFQAAATAYASHGEPMIPFYIFYSMFGFQRTGDQIWQCADARARGFLLGATAGRTSLNGEGLQHQDGHTHVISSTVPSVISYDPGYAYEVAAIIRDGLRRMYANNEDVIYYLTLYNDSYSMPAKPEGVDEGILRGIYLLKRAEGQAKHRARLFGSGPLLRIVLKAQGILQDRYDVAADVYSVTSYTELRRDAIECDRENMHAPTDKPLVPYIHKVLEDGEGPIVAVSDCVKAIPDQIARWVPADFYPLGTDGFGMSDTRKALRRHFEVDSASIVIATLHRLMLQGKVDPSVVTKAMKELEYDPDKRNPMVP